MKQENLHQDPNEGGDPLREEDSDFEEDDEEDNMVSRQSSTLLSDPAGRDIFTRVDGTKCVFFICGPPFYLSKPARVLKKVSHFRVSSVC